MARHRFAEKYILRQRLKKFGLSEDDLRALRDKQNNSCAICGGSPTEKRGEKVKDLAIDHCHKTGKVRGLLCSKCNRALGNMHDDPVLLKRAAEYIEQNAPRED